ncbi:hypothetical protein BELL_0300g00040 [Botrytis elliptica]|uniref:Uncharacterized protein n=1 Tax=Botrytis elliptica TaxID=278938 RepID=A0A4Z1JKB9_9HELO|nr:hypothetical protein BELL_0300g00040 [Botrytis elliptica]
MTMMAIKEGDRGRWNDGMMEWLNGSMAQWLNGSMAQWLTPGALTPGMTKPSLSPPVVGCTGQDTEDHGVINEPAVQCAQKTTTAHPSYALIILDNRDEFILRPTSKPHWWSFNHQEILSSRDLQRAEQGTWLGITKAGNFAVLTNYRETNTHDKDHPVQGTRSRGGMVTAWLTAENDESTKQFVHRLLDGDGVKGVGGFSLVCGKLRKERSSDDQMEPLAIISNRSGTPDEVPWVAANRGEVYGLSNTSYDDPITWPKIKSGKEKVLEVVEEVVLNGFGEEELIKKLFTVLDIDTLPKKDDSQDFEEYIYQLRKSIFIPTIGHAAPASEVPKADEIAAAVGKVLSSNEESAVEMKEERIKDQEEQRPTPENNNVISGIYGTQRQTIILVDWQGHVTFIERSLFDEEGNPMERGQADMRFEFNIEGWNGESKGNERIPARSAIVC